MRRTPDGIMVVYFLTSAPSTPTAPTQAEITAGTNCVGTGQAEELFEITGFKPEPSSLPTPGFSSRYVGNVAGEITFPTGVMSFYIDTVSAAIRTALATDTEGYVFIGMDGLGSGEEGLLFPVTVAGSDRRMIRNAPDSFDVTFSTSAPYTCTQAA